MRESRELKEAIRFFTRESRIMDGLCVIAGRGTDMIFACDGAEIGPKTLVLMTSTEGIYRGAGDPATLVEDVTGTDIGEVEEKVRRLQESCIGASRAGANGAGAKLEYALECARNGTTVIIGHARHRLSDLTEGRVACTRIGLKR